MKPINILHLQPGLKNTCGVTRFLQTVTKNHSDGFTHYIICRDGDAVNRFKNEGIKVYQLPRIPAVLYGFADILLINKFIKDHKIDIVHSHHRYFDLLGYILSIGRRIKTVTSVHSMAKGKKWISYKADRLIAVSNAVKNHLLTNFNVREESVYVLPNGIDIALYNTDDNLFLLKTEKTVGFIGRLSKEKGLDLLLEIFVGFAEEHIPYKLIIAGSGELENQVRKYCNKYPAAIEYLGAVSNVETIYKQIDLLAIPSRIDPFPYTMLECGVFGKPLICFAVDGIAEYVEHDINGILVKPGNSERFAEEIKLLLQDDERRIRLGKNLYKKVLRQSMVKDFIYGLEKIYREITD